MKLKQLRSKDVNKELEPFNISLNKKDSVQLREDGIILVNNKPQFFYYEQKIVPTLHLLQERIVLPTITVDMGAIKFVINGADIMRPGITEISEGIKKDDFIVIIDQNNHKPLAVGIALLETDEIKSAKSGKVIKNIHYIGDWIWKT
ncbi:MAG: RNA-binding protein [archaeon]|nr:RNA-binding protein [archaeon]